MKHVASAITAAVFGFGLTCAGSVRAQTITEYAVPAVGVPTAITAGANNLLWFGTTGYVGRMTPGGGFTTYQVKNVMTCSFPTHVFAEGDGETMGNMALGPDGAMWYTLTTESMIGRVATDGTTTRYSVGTGCVDLQLGEIAAGPDGAMWFTETKTNKIGRITKAGVVTEYAVPTANAGPKQMTTGPDGNVWFTESARNAIGRVNIDGNGNVTMTEFTTPGRPGEMTTGPDGNLWYINDALQAAIKIGRVTPAGVTTEFTVPAPGDVVVGGGITTGPDGNIWFTESVETLQSGDGTYLVTASKIGRITPIGVITEYGHGTASANPGKIASQAGSLYFTEAGQLNLAQGGPTGNKIGQFAPPSFFPAVHIAAVFSTAQSATQSYIRLYNTGTVGGTAKLTISDYTTGQALASITTPVIQPNTAPQYGIAGIEAAATTAFTKPAYYTLTVEPQFTGSVAHVLYRPADGTLTNLSTCDRGVTSGLQQVGNVHSKFVGSGLFPSSIVIYNGALAATTVGLTIYDASNGNQVGTYTSASIQPNGQAVIPMSTIEAGFTTPTGLLHYVVKANTSFTGYLQHIVNNTQAGVITDMSTVCSIGPVN